MPRLLTLLLFLSLAASSAHAAPDFAQDIAPLLRQYCAGCHNDQDLEGDLSLERFSDLSENLNLRPGRPQDSQLIRLVTGSAKNPMPPADEPQLSPFEVEILKSWILAGAPGPAQDQDVSILSTLAVPTLPASSAPEPVTAVAAAPGGRRLALARYQSVHFTLPTSPSQPLRRLSGPALPGKVNSLHFSPDGSRLATASGVTGLNGLATLWDTATGQPLLTLGEGLHRDVLYDAKFSPDGSLLATASYDQSIALWELPSGRLLRSIRGHNGAIFDLAFSPDGSLLASASADQTVKIWQVSSGQRLDTLNQPQGEQFALAFTPDGQRILAAGADRRIRLWKLLSRTKPQLNPLLHARFAHEAAITRLAVSPDGKSLLSASDDRSIKQWSLPDLVQIQAWENQPGIVSGIAFLDDSRFAAARLDGSVASFSMRPPSPSSTTSSSQSSAPGAGPLTASPSSPPLAASPAPGPLQEVEPNDTPSEATAIPSLPTSIRGLIAAPGDADLFWFHAQAGESWVFEIEASRAKSALDSKLEILHPDGSPVGQVRLQALRDSWFTFRGKNSDTASDFRIHNWTEMELNEYLYANGEVVRLWLYPRGPDSGFLVYPGFDKRRTYFNTTALSHALGQPAYIVQPLPPGASPVPNGLPLITLYYENDDDPDRYLGKDSRLSFTAPATSDYLVRVTDVRGQGGPDYPYTLHLRAPRPDFSVALEQLKDPALFPGESREFVLKASRFDGFEGPIQIDVSGLPPGFTTTSPITIEAGQYTAMGLLHAAPDAPAPDPAHQGSSHFTATATIAGRSITKPIGSFGQIKAGPPPKFLVRILPEDAPATPDGASPASTAPFKLTIRPGQTISALVEAERLDFKDRITFGTDDAGRNFPHGLYVDNIGLNGLMLSEGQTRQRLFITAAPWVKPSSRLIHLRANEAPKPATPPVLLEVVTP